MTTRQDRLVKLLSDATATSEIRAKASDQLTDLVLSHPDTDHADLADRLAALLRHRSAEVRSLAARPLAMCMSLEQWMPVDRRVELSAMRCSEVLDCHRRLYASGLTAKEEEEAAKMSVEERKKYFREHFEIRVEEEVAEIDRLVTAEDLTHQVPATKRRKTAETTASSSVQGSDVVDLTAEDDDEFAEELEDMLSSSSRLRDPKNRALVEKYSGIFSSGNAFLDAMTHQDWVVRHGVILTLKHFVARNGGNVDLAVRCLAVLTLDRVCDFTSEPAIAPVRELAAQSLSLMAEEGEILEKVIQYLVELGTSKYWQTRMSAVLGVQYIMIRNPSRTQAIAGRLLQMLSRESSEDVLSLLCSSLRLCIDRLDEQSLETMVKSVLHIVGGSESGGALVNAIQLLSAAASKIQLGENFQCDASILQRFFRHPLPVVREHAFQAAMKLDISRIDPVVLLDLTENSEHRIRIWENLGSPVLQRRFLRVQSLFSNMSSLQLLGRSLLAHPSEGSDVICEIIEQVLEPSSFDKLSDLNPAFSRIGQDQEDPSRVIDVLFLLLTVVQEADVVRRSFDLERGQCDVETLKTAGSVSDRLWNHLNSFIQQDYQLPGHVFGMDFARLRSFGSHVVSLNDAIQALRERRDSMGIPGLAGKEDEYQAAMGALGSISKMRKFFRFQSCVSMVASGRLPAVVTPIVVTLLEDPSRLNGQYALARLCILSHYVLQKGSTAEKLVARFIQPENGLTFLSAVSELTLRLGPDLFKFHPVLKTNTGTTREFLFQCLDQLHPVCLNELVDDAFLESIAEDATRPQWLTRIAQLLLDKVMLFLLRTGRIGRVGLIHPLVDALGIRILPYAVLMVRPLMMAMTSGAVGSERESAAAAFAKIVQLIPLAPADQLRSKEGSFEADYERELRFLQGLLDSKSISRFELPHQLQGGVKLREYQRDGVSWLAFLREYGLHGILADDMGLGKTLQTICILMSTPGRHLIVCPTTLVLHWRNEMEKYAGHVLTPDRVDVVSYNDVRATAATVWSHHHYSFVVLDEGHLVRNPKSKLSQAIRSLHGQHRLILTGTPIQNSAMELVTLFGFLMPGFFSSQDTKDLERLHRQVLPFILRRRKEDVLHDLPPKIIQDVLCEPSEVQRDLYLHLMKRFSASSEDKVVRRFSMPAGQNVGATSSGPVAATASAGSGGGQQHQQLKLLHYLRRLCTHPMLCTAEFTGSNVSSSTVQDRVQEIGNFDEAPKFTALGELLSSLREGGHRALIFAQTRVSLLLIEHYILNVFNRHAVASGGGGDQDGTSMTIRRMDGLTSPAERARIVHEFNNDATIDALLLSTQVGGLGLTLTGADTVIFMEHDWNPQVDLQAMDRAHRLGQTKTVQVYRLVVRDLLEERIMGLQAFKMAIARTVVNEDNVSTSSMTRAGADVLGIVQDAAQEVVAKQQQQQQQQTKHGVKMSGPYAKLLSELDSGNGTPAMAFDDEQTERMLSSADEFSRAFSAGSSTSAK